MRSALLLGREHPRLGTVDTIAEGPAAIAISAGGTGKSYAHTDPNEDAALFALGEGGALLAVADGHAGFDAAEAALEHLLERFAPRWTAAAELRADAWADEALAALESTDRAILERTAKSEKAPARTTLALAVTRPGRDLLLVASIGDSHVFRADPDGAFDLASEGRPCEPSYFLGRTPKSQERLEKRAVVEATALGGARALVLATDGLSEIGVGVEDPEAAVAAAAEHAGRAAPDLRAREAARSTVETALEAHRHNRSGDNVAAAVLWLEP